MLDTRRGGRGWRLGHPHSPLQQRTNPRTDTLSKVYRAIGFLASELAGQVHALKRQEEGKGARGTRGLFAELV